MSVDKVINFWLAQEQLDVKHLLRDNAARICNSLLQYSYQNRQEMGHFNMLKAHILNSAFLRQSCLSSVEDIADSFDERSSDDQFFNDSPYLKAGFEAKTASAIDQYLEENHADDATINNSTIVEGQVMVKFVRMVDKKTVFTHHIELSSDLGEFIRSCVTKKSSLLRFSYNEKLLNSSRTTLPHELGMKSRGEYTITISHLTDEEIKAQNCIASFMVNCHIQKRVKVILARNVIADFVWRCNEREKAREVVSAFIWKYHQQQKAQRLIGNLIWSKIAI